MTTNTALATTVIAVSAAIIGVVVSAGLPLSKDLQDHIMALITVATPAIIGLVAWMHHNSVKATIGR